MSHTTVLSEQDRNTIDSLFKSIHKSDPVIQNTAFENFLILQSKLERELIAISGKEKFKRIFTTEIVKAIGANTGKKFIEDIITPQISIKTFLESRIDGYSQSSYWPKLRVVSDRNSLLVPLYALAAGLSYEDAVRSIANELQVEYRNIADVPIPEGYKIKLNSEIKYDFYDANNKVFFVVCALLVSNHDILAPCSSEGLFFPPESNSPLFNLNLVGYNRDATIFLTESLPLAQSQQKYFSYRFREQQFKKQAEYWAEELKEFNNADEQYKLFNNNQSSDKVLPCIKDISKIEVNIKHLLQQNESWVEYDNVPSHIYRRADTVWCSWYGGFDRIDTVDWTPLQNRTVYYVQYGEVDEKKLYANLLALYEKLRGLENLKLKFIYIPKITDLLNKENNPIQVMCPQDLLYTAFESGIEIPESLKDELSEILNKKGKGKNEEFLIWPIIGRKGLVLLTAATGVGKSFQALNLGYALANKGKLFNNWIIRRACKVLYICDSELDKDTLEERKNIFKKMYKDDDNSSNIMIQSVDNYDLLDKKFQKIIDNFLLDCQLNNGEKGQPVKLLILDHLTKLAPAALQKEKWVSLRPWFIDLKARGIAVLLLNHITKDGVEMHGTSLIENDATVRIHLNEVIDNKTKRLTMAITVPKNMKFPKQTEPYIAQLVTGKHPHWIEYGSQSSLNWKSMSNEEKIIKIKELRNDKTVPEIAAIFSRGPNTIEKFLTEHGLTKKRNP